MRKALALPGFLVAVMGMTACPADEPAPRPEAPPVAEPAERAPPTLDPQVADEPAPRADAPPVAEPAERAPPALDPQVAAELPPGVTAEMISRGQQLYGTVCIACHGAGGGGTPLGPALNDQDWIHITGEFDEIVNITRAGVMQPVQYPAPMPPNGGGAFSEDQVRAIGAYVYMISRGA
jgi:mono/diheme cytochrome c family protein